MVLPVVVVVGGDVGGDVGGIVGVAVVVVIVVVVASWWAWLRRGGRGGRCVVVVVVVVVASWWLWAWVMGMGVGRGRGRGWWWPVSRVVKRLFARAHEVECSTLTAVFLFLRDNIKFVSPRTPRGLHRDWTRTES